MSDRVLDEVDHPLPPPDSDMVMATPEMFDWLRPDSFEKIPGFDPLVRRSLDHVRQFSGGMVDAMVLKAVPGVPWEGSPWHMHHLEFQLVMITKGWANFEFEGIGRVTLGEGAVFFQPPVNRHRELDNSPDWEGLSLVIPPRFDTTVFAFDEETREYTPVRMDTEAAGELADLGEQP